MARLISNPCRLRHQASQSRHRLSQRLPHEKRRDWVDLQSMQASEFKGQNAQTNVEPQLVHWQLWRKTGFSVLRLTRDTYSISQCIRNRTRAFFLLILSCTILKCCEHRTTASHNVNGAEQELRTWVAYRGVEMWFG